MPTTMAKSFKPRTCEGTLD